MIIWILKYLQYSVLTLALFYRPINYILTCVYMLRSHHLPFTNCSLSINVLQCVIRSMEIFDIRVLTFVLFYLTEFACKNITYNMANIILFKSYVRSCSLWNHENTLIKIYFVVYPAFFGYNPAVR